MDYLTAMRQKLKPAWEFSKQQFLRIKNFIIATFGPGEPGDPPHSKLGVASLVIPAVNLALIVLLLILIVILGHGSFRRSLIETLGFFTLLVLVTGPIGLGLGIAGLIQKRKKRAFAVAGSVASALPLMIFLLFSKTISRSFLKIAGIRPLDPVLAAKIEDLNDAARHYEQTKSDQARDAAAQKAMSVLEALEGDNIQEAGVCAQTMALAGRVMSAPVRQAMENTIMEMAGRAKGPQAEFASSMCLAAFQAMAMPREYSEAIAWRQSGDMAAFLESLKSTVRRWESGLARQQSAIKALGDLAGDKTLPQNERRKFEALKKINAGDPTFLAKKNDIDQIKRFLFLYESSQKFKKAFQNYCLGLTAFGNKNYQAAQQHFQETLAGYPQFTEAHIELGRLNLIASNPGKAMDFFKTGAGLVRVGGPADIVPAAMVLSRAYNGMAMVYYEFSKQKGLAGEERRTRRRKARSFLRESLKLDPQNQEAHKLGKLLKES
ncbi:MAG: hypothetical protein HY747_00025 [Elusimicrobia bacterium]|nr:hypothetical protein [Elusimicrobiota bacterium]